MKAQTGALLIGGPCDGQMHTFEGKPILTFTTLKQPDPFAEPLHPTPVSVGKIRYGKELVRVGQREVWFYVYERMSAEDALGKLFANYRPNK